MQFRYIADTYAWIGILTEKFKGIIEKRLLIPPQKLLLNL